jgi:superfamily II DNA or RNA helicase
MTGWEGTDRPPRAWQVACRLDVLRSIEQGGTAGLVSAIMGAGKSALTAELCRDFVARGWRVAVTVPSQALVTQTAPTIAARCPAGSVGTYWQHARELAPVTVACTASLAALAEEPYAPDVWIADEAHGTEAATALAFRDAVAPRVVVGLSATPFRSDDRQALSIFSDLIHEYTAADAMRDGVLVPWTFPDPDPLGMAGKRVDLDEACTAWIKRRIDAGDGPGVVDADDIADAEEYAAALSCDGVRAMAVHSRLSRAAVAERIASLQRGDLDCLVHVAMLVEGVDLPWLRWMCLRRRRGSRVAHVQHIGRGLRAAPGKTHCAYFDPHGLFQLHSLSDPARLGEYLRKTPGEREAVERITLIDPITGEPVEIPRAKAEARKILIGFEASQWLAGASTAIRADGVAAPPPPDVRRWRSGKATPRQIETLDRWVKTSRWMATDASTKETPELRDLARAFRAVNARRESARSGVVSDLLTVLSASRHKRDETIASLRRYGVTWPTHTRETLTVPDGDEAQD